MLASVRNDERQHQQRIPRDTMLSGYSLVLAAAALETLLRIGTARTLLKRSARR